MPLGWIDFSKSERNKVMNVIHLLNIDNQGAVDELGIGAVRDAFADYFFPGTSTVQTRAKYFLIVPYVLMEAGTGAYGADTNVILRRISDEERKCRDILIRKSTDGVIGSLVPDSWVIRAPSNIYWNGIRKLGIFKADLSVREYVRQSLLQRAMKQAKSYGNRNDEAEENEKDDTDAGDISTFQFWNLGDNYHRNWRDGLSIELLPEEAAFLKTQIITTQRGTLFAYILRNQIDMDRYDSFGALSEELHDSVGPELSSMMNLANQFNDLVMLLTTRYNIIASAGKNERACERWSYLSQDLKRRCEVDLQAIFRSLSIRRPKLKTFLLAAQDGLRRNDMTAVDRLIIEQEVRLKDKNRAKTLRADEYAGQNWIGLYLLDYRFTPAQRIVRDIMHAMEGSNV